MAVNGFVHFLAMYGHIFRRNDAEPNLIATDLDDRDDNVVVDYDTLVFFPGQNKHGCVSFRFTDPDKEDATQSISVANPGCGHEPQHYFCIRPADRDP